MNFTFGFDDIKNWLNLRNEEINIKLSELLKIANDLHLFAPTSVELIVTVWFNEYGYLNFSVRVFRLDTNEEITQNLLGISPNEPKPNNIIITHYRLTKDDDSPMYDPRKFVNMVNELHILKNEINSILSEIYAFKIFRIVLNSDKTEVEGIAIEAPDFYFLLRQGQWDILRKSDLIGGKTGILIMPNYS